VKKSNGGVVGSCGGRRRQGLGDGTKCDSRWIGFQNVRHFRQKDESRFMILFGLKERERMCLILLLCYLLLF